MTIRDLEVLEALREEPELLAIADAVAETQRLARTPRRRAISRAAALVALGVAVLLAVMLWPGGSGGNTVIDRALAAVEGRGPVLHAVLSESEGLRVNLATGETRPASTRFEVWYDKDRQRSRVIVRQGGDVAFDETFSGDAALNAAILADVPLGETNYYRDALAGGKAKVVGSGTWRGHSVYWLELADSTARVGVDRDTYRPVVVQSFDSHGRATGHEVGLLGLEYLPRRVHQFGAASPVAGMTAGITSDGRPSLPPARARTALGVPAAWAGARFKGFPLQKISVNATTFKEGGKPAATDSALRLLYGPDMLVPGAGGKGVEIVEMAAGSPAWSEWPVPRIGFANLETFDVLGFERSSPSTGWSAVLRFRRLWVSIEAPTRQLVLAAARALRPLPAR
jgi:hypothetical protein